MGFVNFNKANPYKLEFVYPGLFYKHNDKWVCLATNCKMDPVIDSEPGFRYLDTDGLIHHFYDEVESSDIPYDTTKLVSDNPYTTFKPVKEDTANGIQD